MLLSAEMLNMLTIQHSPKSGYFRGNNSTYVSNVLRSAEMLNMLNHVGSSFRKNVLLSAEKLNMLNYFGSMESQKGPNRPKIIQHIQHIQHFSKKKHFFRKRHST